MSASESVPRDSTACARGAARVESSSPPLVAPLELSVVYCPADLDHVDALYTGGASGFIYARDGHPNAAELAKKLARLEGAEAGLICASGMGAIAAAFLTLLSQNDHALISDGVYGKTSSLATKLLPRWGIRHDVFDPAMPADELKGLVRPTTRMIFSETISNPLLRIANLESMARVARAAGVPLVVDNTFSPLICRPIDHGASLVMHSVTKMIGGHSDLTLGALVGAKSMIEQVSAVASTLGQTGNPFESWLAQRGLATLSLRFHRACATALELARRFESHDAVEHVHYPGLPTHPDFELASRVLTDGFGAIVTIDLGTRERAQTFIRNLADIPFAPSLGDVQTTLSHPTSTSHRGQSADQLARQGISAGMVRISVGIEDAEDLWREFCGALDAVSVEQDNDDARPAQSRFQPIEPNS
jgi:cystathionine beta-lyase/cystathionine gamma-synthase